VTQLRRRSKYILADLSSEEIAAGHLELPAGMLISGDSVGAIRCMTTPPRKNMDHVVVSYGQRLREGNIYDPRRFGAMDSFGYGPKKKFGGPTAISCCRPFGPEAACKISNEGAHLIGRAERRRTPRSRSALLDRGSAGLGNILCLAKHVYRTGIHPARKAAHISGPCWAGWSRSSATS